MSSSSTDRASVTPTLMHYVSDLNNRNDDLSDATAWLPKIHVKDTVKAPHQCLHTHLTITGGCALTEGILRWETEQWRKRGRKDLGKISNRQ